MTTAVTTLDIRMAKVKLTQKYIDNAKPRISPTTGKPINSRFGDANVPGLYLIVTANGHKSYALHYSSPEIKGYRPWINLGPSSNISLSDARIKAYEHRKAISSGIDPKIEHKRQESDAARGKANASSTTFKRLMECRIEDMKRQGIESWYQVERAAQKDIYPIIGHIQAKNVSPEDIKNVLAPVQKRGKPGMALKLHVYLYSAFKFGRALRNNSRWEQNEAPDFQILANPLQDMERPSTAGIGSNYLNRDEIRDFWHAAGIEAMNPAMALAIKFLLATGQRVTEVIEANWSEFNNEEKMWTIPWQRRKSRNNKNSRNHDHIVPLTDFHIDLLKQVKELSNGSEFLFPNSTKNKPHTYHALHQSLERFCTTGKNSKRKGFRKFTPRDCRRTFKTLSSKYLRLGIEMRNRIQGHALEDVGSVHYDMHDYLDEKREAMQLWTDWLTNTVAPNIYFLKSSNLGK